MMAIHVIVELLPALAVVAVMGASAFGYGRWLLSLIEKFRGPISRGIPRQEQLFTLAVGLGALALLVFTLGVAGLLVRPALAAVLVIGLLGGLIGRFWPRRLGREPSASETAGSNELTRTGSTVRFLLACGLAATIGLIGLGVLMPEFFHDALIYHLELPGYYLLHHRIRFLPWNYNSALPAGIEMLYVVALAFADERATKLIHAALGLLCVATLTGLAAQVSDRRTADGRTTGRLAGALFLTTPSVVLLATVSGTDLGLTFFELLSLSAWLHWRNALQGSAGTGAADTSLQAQPWLILSAVMMGCALGTKYSALFFLIGMTIAWGAMMAAPPRLRPRAALVKSIGLWCGIALGVASPWYLKNLLATGDPFYPTFAAHLRPPIISPLGLEWLRRDVGTGGIAVALWPDYLTRLLTNDVGWLTCAAALAVALFARRLPAVRPLLAVTAGSLIAWWLISPVPRYLTPTVALLALIAAVGLATAATGHRIMRIITVIAVAAALGGNLVMAASLIRENYLSPFTARRGIDRQPPEPLSTDREPSSSLITVMRDGPERRQWLAWSVPPYAVIEAANHILPASATVLFVGEYRGYYLDRDRIIGTRYDQSPFITWAETAATPEALELRLRQEGITHLLYNQIDARRLEQAGYPAARWPDERTRMLFEQFRRERLTLLTVENGVLLYAVGAPQPDTSSP